MVSEYTVVFLSLRDGFVSLAAPALQNCQNAIATQEGKNSYQCPVLK
jgi:hypothetical protein